MIHNVVAPSVGESITEVSILKWAKQDGEAIKSGDVLLEIESDKATVEIVAENDGVLKILKQDGETIPVGETIGAIDDAASASTTATTTAAPKTGGADSPPQEPPTPLATSPATPVNEAQKDSHLSPSVRKIVNETGADVNQINGTGKGGRLTPPDVINFVQDQPVVQKNAPTASAQPITTSTPQNGSAAVSTEDKPGIRRVPMSRIRKRIAERLLQAQQNAAILTTFNEVDLTEVMRIRNKYKDAFKLKHGVPLSFMSFFTRGACMALKEIEAVNGYIDGDDIIYHDYCDVAIAVGTDRGLVVPVVRNAGELTFVGIEKSIGALAAKARDGKLSIAEMTGGTFTISNGGTYGSMLSTPILNPPQSAILGMHNIIQRPVAVSDKVEIRPMMYLALSYDHRIIDGKEAVTFLVRLREFLENPEKLNLDFVNDI